MAKRDSFTDGFNCMGIIIKKTCFSDAKKDSLLIQHAELKHLVETDPDPDHQNFYSGMCDAIEKYLSLMGVEVITVEMEKAL